MSQTDLPSASRSPEWDDPWRRWEATADRPNERPLSKAAVTSFVLSLCTLTLPAIGFGIVGINATGRGGDRRGRGFAVAGLVISGIWLVVIAVVVAIGISGRAERGLDGAVQQSGTSSYLDLQRGDCLQDPGVAPTGGEVARVDVVPCTEPHDAQVFAIVSPAAGEFNDEIIKAEVEQLCRDRAEVDIAVTDPFDLLYFYPQLDGWKSGHHNSVCMLSSTSRLTSSVITP